MAVACIIGAARHRRLYCTAATNWEGFFHLVVEEVDQEFLRAFT